MEEEDEVECVGEGFLFLQPSLSSRNTNLPFSSKATCLIYTANESHEGPFLQKRVKEFIQQANDLLVELRKLEQSVYDPRYHLFPRVVSLDHFSPTERKEIKPPVYVCPICLENINEVWTHCGHGAGCLPCFLQQAYTTYRMCVTPPESRRGGEDRVDFLFPEYLVSCLCPPSPLPSHQVPGIYLHGDKVDALLYAMDESTFRCTTCQNPIHAFFATSRTKCCLSPDENMWKKNPVSYSYAKKIKAILNRAKCEESSLYFSFWNLAKKAVKADVKLCSHMPSHKALEPTYFDVHVCPICGRYVNRVLDANMRTSGCFTCFFTFVMSNWRENKERERVSLSPANLAACVQILLEYGTVCQENTPFSFSCACAECLENAGDGRISQGSLGRGVKRKLEEGPLLKPPSFVIAPHSSFHCPVFDNECQDRLSWLVSVPKS